MANKFGISADKESIALYAEFIGQTIKEVEERMSRMTTAITYLCDEENLSGDFVSGAQRVLQENSIHIHSDLTRFKNGRTMVEAIYKSYTNVEMKYSRPQAEIVEAIATYKANSVAKAQA